MSRFKKIFPALSLILAVMLTGCIKNDIPYPHIKVNFTSFEVENSLRATAIDSVQRTLTVYLSEEADIYNVVVNGFAINPSDGVWADSAQYLNGIDMSAPLTTVLSLYQDYTWTVTAVQNIERYFSVEMQIGASDINVDEKTVTVHVSDKAPITGLLVKSVKLAGPSAVYSPVMTDERIDFSQPVKLDVTEFGRTTEWTVTVIPTEEIVSITSIDAWSCVAWLYGTGETGRQNGFEYREKGTEQWTRLTDDQVTVDGGAFTGKLTGLTPLTTYEARAYSDDYYTVEDYEFTTQGTAQMPNSDFENWWLDGKIWCPWAEDGTPYWGTGNKGATMFGSSNTYPSDDTPTGTGRSACLETKFVGIRPFLGKLAAGNIFAGVYVRTDGTDGVLSFGRPWDLRPTSLRGWFKYHSAPISDVSSELSSTVTKGEPDKGIIWIALIDSDEPFELRTKKENRHLFDPEGPEVIAYGKMEWDYDVDEWTQFEITLDYRSTSRVPKYILCTASASWLGDYYTGGDGSKLMIDDLELLFDY